MGDKEQGPSGFSENGLTAAFAKHMLELQTQLGPDGFQNYLQNYLRTMAASGTGNSFSAAQPADDVPPLQDVPPKAPSAVETAPTLGTTPAPESSSPVDVTAPETKAYSETFTSPGPSGTSESPHNQECDEAMETDEHKEGCAGVCTCDHEPEMKLKRKRPKEKKKKEKRRRKSVREENAENAELTTPLTRPCSIVLVRLCEEDVKFGEKLESTSPSVESDEQISPVEGEDLISRREAKSPRSRVLSPPHNDNSPNSSPRPRPRRLSPQNCSTEKDAKENRPPVQMTSLPSAVLTDTAQTKEKSRDALESGESDERSSREEEKADRIGSVTDWKKKDPEERKNNSDNSRSVWHDKGEGKESHEREMISKLEEIAVIPDVPAIPEPPRKKISAVEDLGEPDLVRSKERRRPGPKSKQRPKSVIEDSDPQESKISAEKKDSKRSESENTAGKKTEIKKHQADKQEDITSKPSTSSSRKDDAVSKEEKTSGSLSKHQKSSTSQKKDSVNSRREEKTDLKKKNRVHEKKTESASSKEKSEKTPSSLSRRLEEDSSSRSSSSLNKQSHGINPKEDKEKKSDSSLVKMPGNKKLSDVNRNVLKRPSQDVDTGIHTQPLPADLKFKRKPVSDKKELDCPRPSTPGVEKLENSGVPRPNSTPVAKKKEAVPSIKSAEENKEFPIDAPGQDKSAPEVRMAKKNKESPLDIPGEVMSDVSSAAESKIIVEPPGEANRTKSKFIKAVVEKPQPVGNVRQNVPITTDKGTNAKIMEIYSKVRKTDSSSINQLVLEPRSPVSQALLKSDVRSSETTIVKLRDSETAGKSDPFRSLSTTSSSGPKLRGNPDVCRKRLYPEERVLSTDVERSEPVEKALPVHQLPSPCRGDDKVLSEVERTENLGSSASSASSLMPPPDSGFKVPAAVAPRKSVVNSASGRSGELTKTPSNLTSDRTFSQLMNQGSNYYEQDRVSATDEDLDYDESTEDCGDALSIFFDEETFLRQVDEPSEFNKGDDASSSGGSSISDRLKEVDEELEVQVEDPDQNQYPDTDLEDFDDSEKEEDPEGSPESGPGDLQKLSDEKIVSELDARIENKDKMRYKEKDAIEDENATEAEPPLDTNAPGDASGTVLTSRVLNVEEVPPYVKGGASTGARDKRRRSLEGNGSLEPSSKRLCTPSPAKVSDICRLTRTIDEPTTPRSVAHTPMSGLRTPIQISQPTFDGTPKRGGSGSVAVKSAALPSTSGVNFCQEPRKETLELLGRTDQSLKFSITESTQGTSRRETVTTDVMTHGHGHHPDNDVDQGESIPQNSAGPRVQLKSLAVEARHLNTNKLPSQLETEEPFPEDTARPVSPTYGQPNLDGYCTYFLETGQSNAYHGECNLKHAIPVPASKDRKDLKVIYQFFLSSTNFSYWFQNSFKVYASHFEKNHGGQYILSMAENIWEDNRCEATDLDLWLSLFRCLQNMRGTRPSDAFEETLFHILSRKKSTDDQDLQKFTQLLRFFTTRVKCPTYPCVRKVAKSEIPLPPDVIVNIVNEAISGRTHPYEIWRCLIKWKDPTVVPQDMINKFLAVLQRKHGEEALQLKSRIRALRSMKGGVAIQNRSRTHFEPVPALPIVPSNVQPIVSRVEPSVPSRVEPPVPRAESPVASRVQPPVSRVESPVASRVQPPVSRVEPPVASRVQPPVSRVEPPVASRVQPPVSRVEPPVSLKVQPPVARVEPPVASRVQPPAQRVEPPVSLKVQPPVSRVEPPVASRVEPPVSRVEPPVASRVQPPVSRVEPPVASRVEPPVSRIEPPVASRVEPPVSRVEPPVASRVEPPVSRVEPPVASRVEPPVAPIAQSPALSRVQPLASQVASSEDQRPVAPMLPRIQNRTDPAQETPGPPQLSASPDDHRQEVNVGQQRLSRAGSCRVKRSLSARDLTVTPQKTSARVGRSLDRLEQVAGINDVVSEEARRIADRNDTETKIKKKAIKGRPKMAEKEICDIKTAIMKKKFGILSQFILRYAKEKKPMDEISFEIYEGLLNMPWDSRVETLKGLVQGLSGRKMGDGKTDMLRFPGVYNAIVTWLCMTIQEAVNVDHQLAYDLYCIARDKNFDILAADNGTPRLLALYILDLCLRYDPQDAGRFVLDNMQFLDDIDQNYVHFASNLLKNIFRAYLMVGSSIELLKRLESRCSNQRSGTTATTLWNELKNFADLLILMLLKQGKSVAAFKLYSWAKNKNILLKDNTVRCLMIAHTDRQDRLKLVATEDEYSTVKLVLQPGILNSNFKAYWTEEEIQLCFEFILTEYQNPSYDLRVSAIDALAPEPNEEEAKYSVPWNYDYNFKEKVLTVLENKLDPPLVPRSCEDARVVIGREQLEVWSNAYRNRNAGDKSATPSFNNLRRIRSPVRPPTSADTIMPNCGNESGPPPHRSRPNSTERSPTMTRAPRAHYNDAECGALTSVSQQDFCNNQRMIPATLQESQSYTANVTSVPSVLTAYRLAAASVPSGEPYGPNEPNSDNAVCASGNSARPSISRPRSFRSPVRPPSSASTDSPNKRPHSTDRYGTGRAHSTEPYGTEPSGHVQSHVPSPVKREIRRSGSFHSNSSRDSQLPSLDCGENFSGPRDQTPGQTSITTFWAPYTADTYGTELRGSAQHRVSPPVIRGIRRSGSFHSNSSRDSPPSSSDRGGNFPGSRDQTPGPSSAAPRWRTPNSSETYGTGPSGPVQQNVTIRSDRGRDFPAPQDLRPIPIDSRIPFSSRGGNFPGPQDQTPGPSSAALRWRTPKSSEPSGAGPSGPVQQNVTVRSDRGRDFPAPQDLRPIPIDSRTLSGRGENFPGPRDQTPGPSSAAPRWRTPNSSETYGTGPSGPVQQNVTVRSDRGRDFPALQDQRSIPIDSRIPFSSRGGNFPGPQDQTPGPSSAALRWRTPKSSEPSGAGPSGPVQQNVTVRSDRGRDFPALQDLRSIPVDSRTPFSGRGGNFPGARDQTLGSRWPMPNSADTYGTGPSDPVQQNTTFCSGRGRDFSGPQVEMRVPRDTRLPPLDRVENLSGPRDQMTGSSFIASGSTMRHFTETYDTGPSGHVGSTANHNIRRLSSLYPNNSRDPQDLRTPAPGRGVDIPELQSLLLGPVVWPQQSYRNRVAGTGQEPIVVYRGPEVGPLESALGDLGHESENTRREDRGYDRRRDYGRGNPPRGGWYQEPSSSGYNNLNSDNQTQRNRDFRGNR